MDKKTFAEIFPKNNGHIRSVGKELSQLPPWLFRHRDSVSAFEQATMVGMTSLINTLNHINFIGGPVFILLEHVKYDESIFVKAYPESSTEAELTCYFTQENIIPWTPEEYRFLQLIIDDGKSMILVPATLEKMDKKRLVVQLPETSHAVGTRKVRRHVCGGVGVELFQSGFQANGELVDFNPVGFKIRVEPSPSCHFQWFNSDEPAFVILRCDSRVFFDGPCHCLRHENNLSYKDFVLAPAEKEIRRFRKKHIRNPRQRLVPPPTLMLDHPFLKRKFRLPVSDISTSGFSVYEKASESILMQGMIIPELTVDFGGASRLTCVSQVVYRGDEDQQGKVRCAITILDMDIKEYSRMADILSSAQKPNVHISTEVDLDDLWAFLFKSGFIYPKKYRLIRSYRNDFKETYRKLYQENPEIARHITYHVNGKLSGHMSMLMAYERTWLIHHYAAGGDGGQLTGLVVLKQFMQFLNDMTRLPSARMDYVMSYFRPQSRFPNRVFGGFTREIDDKGKCSMDLFSYLPYTTLSLGSRLPLGWVLRESSDLDTWNFGRFYRHHSGGLLLNVLGSECHNSEAESIKQSYHQVGFVREWNLYSLCHNEKLHATLIVNRSDLGLNLSELLNCIKIIVTNLDGLPWDILSIAIGQLASIYDQSRVPVMIYPVDYVEQRAIPYEKNYQLWILDVHHGNEYMKYMQRNFKIKLVDA